MTSVLRKKIALNTGIPPSIRNAEQFWQQLRVAADAWVLKELEFAQESKFVRCEMLMGEHFAEGEKMPFVISPDDGSGLSAIMLSRGLTVELAAQRMCQSRESLMEASDLFLTLICEDPAMSLKESIRLHLTGNRHDFEGDVGVELSFARTELMPSERYLQVEIEFPLEDRTEQIALLFDFGILKQYLAAPAVKIQEVDGVSGTTKFGLIHKSVQKSDIRIDGVLERVRMTFGACLKLKIGQVIPLVNGDQSSISVAVDTVGGSADISQGRLGVWKRNRAIKLSTPISEKFVRDLALIEES